MPSINAFSSIPPFPGGVPHIDLPRIDLKKLSSGDKAESNALFKTCTETGFFLLNLKEADGSNDLLKEVEDTFQVSKSFFTSPEEEKRIFPLLPSNLGYKQMGGTKIEDGSPDRCEIYGFPQDDLLGLGESNNRIPPAFDSNRALLTSCLRRMHSVAETICRHLDAHLDLPKGTFEAIHSIDKASPSSMRFLHMPPQEPSNLKTSLMGHTDNGSITVLFNIIGGLQILPPHSSEWKYVRPEPGCAIINLGDTMVQWSGGVLRSNMHRVVPPPGAQAASDRYSLAYVLKPPKEQSMGRLKMGRVIPQDEEDFVGDCTYGEFHSKKAAGVREGKNLADNQGGKGTNVKIQIDPQQLVSVA